MERSWKRIIPLDESDSSSSDEGHEKRARNPWKHYLMSKRVKKSTHDGQGTSSSPQEFSHVLVTYPNPSDVLMHHDYAGPTRFSFNANNSCHDVHSPSQLKELGNYSDMPYSWCEKLNTFYRGRHPIFGGGAPVGNVPSRYENDGDEILSDLLRPLSPIEICFNSVPQISNTEVDLSSNPSRAVTSPVQVCFNTVPSQLPIIDVESQYNENDIEPESSPQENRNIDIPRQSSDCTTLAGLPMDHIKNEIVPDRETVVKSPVKTEVTESNVSLEIPSTSKLPTTSEQTNSGNNISNIAPEEEPCQKPEEVTDSNNQTASDIKEEKEKGLNEALLSLLECPVCWDVMPPPIYQCVRGHLLCKPCRKRLSTCPTCRTNFSTNRNLAMEKVAEKLKYPCKNSSSGCSVLVLLREKREHEANCPHRLYSCLSPFCAPRWTCKLTNLPHHYETLHSQMLLRGPTHVLKINHDFYRKPASLDWIILAFEQLFRVNIHSVPPGDVYGCVQYIGPHSVSRKFIYELKTHLPLEIFRCIRFERTTHSDLTKIDKHYAKKDSFYLPDSWTKNFKSDHDIPRSISRLEISVTVRPA